MPDLLQFFCPACGASLKVPASMAGISGPCPCCRREIAAPGPSEIRQTLTISPPPREPEFRPLAATTTDSQGEETSTPKVAPPPPESAPPKSPVDAPDHPESRFAISSPKTPHRAVLVLSILLTAVLGLLAGYVIGARSHWLVSRIAPPVVRPATPPVNLPPPEPPAKTVIAIAPVDEPTEPAPVPKPNPVNASAAAEAALKAFFDAPDWTTRSSCVLNPAKVRTAMEIHSRIGPDGPISWKSLSLSNSHTDTVSGNTTFIFKAVTERHPTGIPVAIVETPSGWLVDWESFVEFHDDLFKRFVDGPADQTAQFHLIASQPPADRAARTENEHFVSFLLDPPLPERQQLAYVKKGSGAQIQLSEATASGSPFTPVLELARKTSPDGKNYLEILAVKADNWLPATE
jgi:hypothetical protein